MPAQRDYRGPAVLSAGFRPFFLAAAVFALGVIPAWWLVWRGRIELAGPMPSVDWHVHEMVYGYGSAVLAGFLFTAVPNWTGRMPARGTPLLLLLALWIAGRLAMLGGLGASPLLALLVDQAFLLAVAAMIAREIVAGRNWRNLKVVVPVTLLWVANVAFHLEVMARGTSDIGHRLGIGLLIFLILLIGGRIVPSFTRNWLAKRAAEGGDIRMPVPFDRFDFACLAVGALALALWTALPGTALTGIVAGVAALLHVRRLARWRGTATWRSPLLLMLHAAYAMVPLGLFAVSAAAFGLAGPAIPAHLLGIGAVGGMTVAVMMRASMGHTGRALVAGRRLTAAFALVLAAVAARLLGPVEILPGVDGITLAAIAWTAAFALLVQKLAPWLVTERFAPRRPGGRASATPAAPS